MRLTPAVRAASYLKPGGCVTARTLGSRKVSWAMARRGRFPAVRATQHTLGLAMPHAALAGCALKLARRVGLADNSPG